MKSLSTTSIRSGGNLCRSSLRSPARALGLALLWGLNERARSAVAFHVSP
jgi:hypothetical protein